MKMEKIIRALVTASAFILAVHGFMKWTPDIPIYAPLNLVGPLNMCTCLLCLCMFTGLSEIKRFDRHEKKSR